MSTEIDNNNIEPDANIKQSEPHDEFKIADDDVILGANFKNASTVDQKTQEIAYEPYSVDENTVDEEQTQMVDDFSNADTELINDLDTTMPNTDLGKEEVLTGLDIIVGDYGIYDSQFTERRAESSYNAERMIMQAEEDDNVESSARYPVYILIGVVVLIAALIIGIFALQPKGRSGNDVNKNFNVADDWNTNINANIESPENAVSESSSTAEIKPQSGIVSLNIAASNGRNCPVPVLIMFSNGTEERLVTAAVGQSTKVSLPYGEWSLTALCSPICSDGTVLDIPDATATIAEGQTACSVSITAAPMDKISESDLANVSTQYINNGFDPGLVNSLVEKAKTKYFAKEEKSESSAESVNNTSATANPDLNENASSSSSNSEHAEDNSKSQQENAEKNGDIDKVSQEDLINNANQSELSA